MANQRIAAGNGQENNLLPDGNRFADFFMLAVGADLFLRDEHSGILGEIDAAIVAGAAVALRRAARRALVEQRGMAPAAKPFGVRVCRLALGAIHA